ncbi:unnamed protein product [Arabidopsis thaliana]|uniref:Putative F-box/FBD/LRR-repeat protein At5g44950 n=1 Tax=Arabidopsis thaliana TaxID=3702 RepID=FDL34_ARATH|nr:F-box/RNI-like/FBD-like domains-containing protein [Arabidopsis thaliana]Q9FLA2.1 RecName: Full=Putative F-box/FBD/LRR-repeat protein At5g44950 [Arabidopsis thaliana]AED95179.1 F-box/RNI-like/FBD-like domains-containing protein [Arabidopsis thaliana]BAB10878.1 unnamed protein product [Arabidopsis thaliana]|eukprot:NP_199308.1 F-box/RNI-like/FBD-like domains-containing protein [Arabidopsis thaliana]
MGRDRISELPDGLLNHILMYLHIEESIRTSVLSSRWRKLWLKVPGLDVNVHDFPADGNLFESLMDKFLEVNRGRLQNFKLNYESNLYYLMDRFVPWIATVVDRGIQHLDVTATDCPPWTIDFMPANICKSKTLVSLKLVNVGLDTPKFVVSLPCLKIMHLEDIFYSPLIAENLISGCPVLEDLTIVRNHEDFLNFLRVMSQTLKNFRLTFDWGMGSNDFSVEIDAPGLKYMSFRDSQSDRIVVKNLSSLVKIDLDTEFNLKFGLGSPLEPEDLTKRDIIRDFLTGISSVKHMIISHPTLEVLYRYSKIGQLPKFHNLYHLQAVFSSSLLQLLPAFLEICPNLKNLILDYSISAEPEQIDFTNLPRCLISTLEYVEIKQLTMREESGIKLVKYFLENSAVLKKLTLSFIDSPMTNQESEIYMQLLTSTKRSRGCHVLIL